MDCTAALSNLRGLLNTNQYGNRGVRGISLSQPSEKVKFKDYQKYLEMYLEFRNSFI